MQKQNKNLPLDIIAAFNPVGQIKPLYVRVEDSGHQLITLPILSIITWKEEKLAGIPRIHYLCEIESTGTQPQQREKQYCNLYYYIDTHKWRME